MEAKASCDILGVKLSLVGSKEAIVPKIRGQIDANSDESFAIYRNGFRLPSGAKVREVLRDDEVVEVKKIGTKFSKIRKISQFSNIKSSSKRTKAEALTKAETSEVKRDQEGKAKSREDLNFQIVTIFGEETEVSPESGVEGRRKAPSFSLGGEGLVAVEFSEKNFKIFEDEAIAKDRTSPKADIKFPFKKFSFRAASSDEFDIKGFVVQDELAPDEGIFEENIFKC